MQPQTSLIWNPILRQYLVNAPHRMHRREGAAACPFCADITEGKVGTDTRSGCIQTIFHPYSRL